MQPSAILRQQVYCAYGSKPVFLSALMGDVVVISQDHFLVNSLHEDNMGAQVNCSILPGCKTKP